MSNKDLQAYTGGIYEDKTGLEKNETNHVINIVGWGEEGGVKFWRARNSWGTYWGEEGFFRIVRGKNNIKIESNCTWGVPKDTWSSKKFSEKLVEGKSTLEAATRDSEGCMIGETVFEGGELIKTNLSLMKIDVPESFDW